MGIFEISDFKTILTGHFQNNHGERVTKIHKTESALTAHRTFRGNWQDPLRIKTAVLCNSFLL